MIGFRSRHHVYRCQQQSASRCPGSDSELHADGRASPFQRDGARRCPELSAAAGRLDQLLNEIEEARRKEAREKDMKMLQAATSCLDHLLAGMTGKEAMPELKLRPKRDTTE